MSESKPSIEIILLPPEGCIDRDACLGHGHCGAVICTFAPSPPTEDPDYSFDEKPADSADECHEILMETIEQIVRSQHHQDGDPIPESWEICQLCEGDGCDHCDETGKLHPRRADYLAYGQAEAGRDWHDVIAIMKGPVGDTLLGRQLRLSLGMYAGQVLRELRAGDEEST
jgi:hypothetical protein